MACLAPMPLRLKDLKGSPNPWPGMAVRKMPTLLDWCQPRCVNETWSRKMSTPEEITVYDTGSRGMPPTMTIGDCEKGASCLQTIVDAWHTHSGMLTCFHEATELIGIHLDRLTRDSSGAICRAAWTVEMDPIVSLPFWDGSMLVRSREYAPVSSMKVQSTLAT